MTPLSRSVLVVAVSIFCVFNLSVASAHHEEGVLQLAQVDSAKEAKKAKKKKAKRECRRVRETGSRIASRVCKKPSQWAREERLARENVNTTREEANRNTATSNSQ